MTLARDSAEEKVIRDALAAAASANLPLAVSDGGSPRAFVEAIAGLPRVVMAPPPRQGLAAQARAAMEAATATGAEFILYSESDKRMFFEHRLRSFLAALAPGEDTGIGVAARSPGSFATYPPLQQFTERTINTLTGEFVGVTGDYSYGPFLVHRSLVRHLASLEREVGWGWRHMLFAVAARAGMRIRLVEDDFPCPLDQRIEHEAERLHRIRQLRQNVDGLLQGMTLPLDG